MRKDKKMEDQEIFLRDVEPIKGSRLIQCKWLQNSAVYEPKSKKLVDIMKISSRNKIDPKREKVKIGMLTEVSSRKPVLQSSGSQVKNKS